jgi:methylmalonyl-CoA mutase N-terminal domain/subunit
LSLPTEEAARIALRTQQIIAGESGVADSIDPLAGSYYLEHLTDELEKRATAYIQTIDDMGGMLPAIEAGYVQREIQEAAYQFQRAMERQEEIVVGVNRYAEEEEVTIDLQKIDPAIEASQRRRLARLRAARDDEKVAGLRRRLANAAEADANLMPHFITCVENDITLGEICHTLRQVWGEYRPRVTI